MLDTSAALDALAGGNADPALIERMGSDGDLHAPHLIDVELLHALRRLLVAGEIEVGRADILREDFAELAVTRYPHRPLSDRIWELRQSITAYDAAFIALAEALTAPLITCDARLGRSGGHQARVEVYGA